MAVSAWFVETKAALRGGDMECVTVDDGVFVGVGVVGEVVDEFFGNVFLEFAVVLGCN